MAIYDNGRLYDWLTLVLTGGRNRRLKARMIERLDIGPTDSVLDWGCGTGVGLQLLLKQGFQGTYHGIEIHAGMLRHAVGRLPKGLACKCDFILRQGFGCQLAEPADFAFAFHSLGVLHPDQFPDGLAEIWRNLRPSAKLLITDMAEPDSAGAHGRLGKWISRRIFGQDFSGTLLPNVERYFEPLVMEREAGTLAFAWIGQRRDEILP